MNNTPFVHIIHSKVRDFIYDVNTNSLIQLDDGCWKYLYEILHVGVIEYTKKYKDNNSSEAQSIIKMLNNGFLKCNRVETIKHPLSDFAEDYLKNRLDGVILQVTQNCNLKCRYCSYAEDDNSLNRSHNNKNMPWEIAKRTLDFLRDHSRCSKYLAIGFYGGEPLLQYNLIAKCIEYIKETFYHAKIKYNITTNGTIMNEEIVRLLTENDIDLMISLDGPERIQNKNRRYAKNGMGSFLTVMENLRFLHDSAPNYYKKIAFNTVVELDTDRLNSVVDFFDNNELLNNQRHQYSLVADDTLNMFYGETAQFKCAREESFFKNIIRYVSGNNIMHDIQYLGDLRTFNRLLKKTYELPSVYHNNGPCIPGQKRLHVDVNGVFRPCERVSESSSKMIIGNVQSGFDFEAVRNLINVGQTLGDKCKSCWAIRLCRICCQRLDCSENVVKERCDVEQKNIESNLRDIAILKSCGVEL